VYFIIGQLNNAPTGCLKFSILEDFQKCVYIGGDNQCKKLENLGDVHEYRPLVKQHEKDIRYANATGTYNLMMIHFLMIQAGN
jgi:hypothetical protein